MAYPSTKEILVARAKMDYPYPLNPFCSSNISVSMVHEALEEAGYKDFQLFVDKTGIYIEPKDR